MREGMPISYANSISDMLMKSGKLDDAEKILHTSLKQNNNLIFNKKTRAKVLALNYGMLGNLLVYRGDLTGAEEQYKIALKNYLKITDHSEAVGITYGNLGGVYELLGDTKAAVESWTQARFVFSVVGDEVRAEMIDRWIKDLEGKI